MNFKTVHGLGRSDYALKAVNYALANGMSPHHVDSWLKWFDQQNDDCHALDNFTAEQRQRMTLQEAIAANPVTLGQCEGIGCDRQCKSCVPFGVACPDDCPQPEYYLGDLEEVAHAVALMTIAEAVDVIQEAHPMHRSTTRDIVGLMQSAAERVTAKISEPGTVEGLLPA